LALFYIFLFYDRSFLHVCYLGENLLFSILILGSVFSDYVVFYGDNTIQHGAGADSRRRGRKFTAAAAFGAPIAYFVGGASKSPAARAPPARRRALL